VLRRLRQEAGFGLIELLMAMTILNVGILATVAAFNSGIVTLRRSGLVADLWVDRSGFDVDSGHYPLHVGSSVVVVPGNDHLHHPAAPRVQCESEHDRT